MSQTYQTKDGTQDGFVPGVGQIVGGKITVPDGIVLENANLELVVDQPQPQAAPVAPAATPSATPVTLTTSPVAPQPAPAPEQQTVNKESE